MLISCAKLMVIFQLSRIFIVTTWINLIYYIRNRRTYQHINTPLLSFKELYRNKIIMIILRLINGQIGYISICIPQEQLRNIWWKTAKPLF